MTLTIISNDSVDVMESMVSKHFDSLKKKEDLPHNLYADLPKPLNVNLKSYAQVLADASDGNTVIVYFQLSPSRLNRDVNPLMTGVNPIQYLSYLLDGDGPGSLNAYLQSTGLAYYVSASIFEQTNFYTIVAFEIGVPLIGMYHLDLIVRAILDYIEFLKEEAIDENVYNAYAEAKRISFDFGDPQSDAPMDQASTLAEHITEDGLDHAFSDGQLLNLYDEEVLRETFDELNTDNMVMILVSNAFVVDQSILGEIQQDARTIADPLKAVNSGEPHKTPLESHTHKKSASVRPAFIQEKASSRVQMRTLIDPPDFEASTTASHSLQFFALDKYLPLFNATYTSRAIPKSFFDKVLDPTNRANDQNIYGNPQFTLPNIHDYLADDLRLICNHTERSKCKAQCLKDASKGLNNVTLDDGSTMWYQMDRSFLVPRLVVSLVLHSPDALESIENYAGFQIFCQMIEAIPADYLSDYAEGDFQTNFGCSRGSAFLFIEGFSDKLSEVIDTLSSALQNFGQSRSDFSTSQITAANEAIQQDTLDPSSRADMLLNGILYTNSYMGTDLVVAIDDISYDTWSEKYGGTKRFYYESLVIGNVNESRATDYVEQIVRAFDLELVDKDEMPTDSTRILSDTYAVYREWNSNTKSLNNEIFNYYQTGPRTQRTEAFLRLLRMPFRNEAFDELRNIRQLGYVVNGAYYATPDSIGFSVEIEGPVKNPLELDGQIENFLAEFNSYLINLTDESFQNIKDAFLSSLDVPPLTLYDKADAYHNEIVDMTYEFHRKKKLAEAGTKLTKDDLVRLYDETMFRHPNKVSVQIWKYDKGTPLSTESLQASETFAHKTGAVYSDLGQLVGVL